MSDMTKEKQNMTGENMTFRYLYAFGILFVVLSHCDGGGFEMLSNWMHFGAFHLAIFVFGSGYFLKNDEMKKPLSYLWKKVKKLLIPLWVLHLAYGILLMGLHKIGFTFGENLSFKTVLLDPMIQPDMFVLDMGAWFVFPFFMVIIVYMAGKALLDLVKAEKVTDIIWQMLLLAISLIIVWYNSRGMVPEQFALCIRVAYFMPFYLLGICYKKYLEQYLQKVPASVILAVCLVIALCANAHFGRVVYAIPSSCDYPFGLIATYLTAIVGITFWLTVSRELAKFPSKITVLQTIGRHTWDIMFHQFFGIMLIKDIFVLLHKALHCFPDLDMERFFGDIWYLYLPKGMPEFKALYVVGAIAVSIAIGIVIERVKQFVQKGLKEK